VGSSRLVGLCCVTHRVIARKRDARLHAKPAIKSGFFATEITPVTLPEGTVVDAHDGRRP
jgi:hypothetical protein